MKQQPIFAPWIELPQFILEEIFGYLPLRYRYYASSVCKQWHDAFWSKGAWQSFVFRDGVFTRSKFTIHAGYQRQLDHYRLRLLITNVTHLWTNLIIKPVSKLYNFYEFVRVLSNFCAYYEREGDHPLSGLKSFEFDWSLKFQTSKTSKEYGSSSRVGEDDSGQSTISYGTGGQLLRGVTQFIEHLTGLESLSLRQLQLDTQEAETFMGDLLRLYGTSLTQLCILNLTKLRHSFLHFGLFLSLEKLVVSPQHLNDDVLILLASCHSLLHLVLIQDENTHGAVPASSKAWIEFKQTSPQIQVHLICRGNCPGEMVWQPKAPVVSIVYSNKTARLTMSNCMDIVENYSATLKVFVQKGLQRKYRSNSFHDRCDSALILLVRSCPRLELICVRERLSTATALLCAHYYSMPFYGGTLTAKDKKFFLRQNAVLKRFDWPFNAGEWSREFYIWLRQNAREYELTRQAISELLHNPSWTFASDNQYMNLFRDRASGIGLNASSE